MCAGGGRGSKAELPVIFGHFGFGGKFCEIAAFFLPKLCEN